MNNAAQEAQRGTLFPNSQFLSLPTPGDRRGHRVARNDSSGETTTKLCLRGTQVTLKHATGNNAQGTEQQNPASLQGIPQKVTQGRNWPRPQHLHLFRPTLKVPGPQADTLGMKCAHSCKSSSPTHPDLSSRVTGAQAAGQPTLGWDLENKHRAPWHWTLNLLHLFLSPSLLLQTRFYC